MKILIKQFLGKNHSWSVCGWGIANSLKSQNNVDLFSTDGVKNLPKSLKENLIGFVEENDSKLNGRVPDLNYDCQISYTAMPNFGIYLSNGVKNRFGIWCYEWAGKNVLPTGFAKHYRKCDKILAPSNFAKQVFLDSGIPDSHIEVIPHGINSINYCKDNKINISNKKFKILANIAQNHLRKNIPALLKAYGKAFSSKDDVCLIVKCKDKEVKSQFEISFKDQINSFYKEFPKHAELKVYSEFVEDISDLYRSVDCIFTMSHCEGFYFPGLEGLAAGKLSIAPNWGGQVDFLNSENSLLIDGKETRANPNSMYWESKPNAIWFEPNIDDAVDKLRFAYENFEKINSNINKEKIHSEYDWNNITKRIMKLCK